VSIQLIDLIGPSFRRAFFIERREARDGEGFDHKGRATVALAFLDVASLNPDVADYLPGPAKL
jgi:hypothetical protein